MKTLNAFVLGYTVVGLGCTVPPPPDLFQRCSSANDNDARVNYECAVVAVSYNTGRTVKATVFVEAPDAMAAEGDVRSWFPRTVGGLVWDLLTTTCVKAFGQLFNVEVCEDGAPSWASTTSGYGGGVLEGFGGSYGGGGDPNFGTGSGFGGSTTDGSGAGADPAGSTGVGASDPGERHPR